MSIYRVRPHKKTEKYEGFSQNEKQEQWMSMVCRNAGVGAGHGRDPVYALCESFSQTFDFVGRQEVQRTVEGRAAALRGTSMLPWIADDGGEFLRRFSDQAFQNGRLAAAILQGQGNAALHACVRRARGAYSLQSTEQRRRVDQTADRLRIPYTDDWVHVGGDVHAAVALVTAATRSATSVLTTIRRAAALLETKDNATLKELFPFLFEEEDLELIQSLRSKRDHFQNNGPERRAIDRALDKATAVLHKKRQMRREFLAKTEKLMANAREAERLFSRLESEGLQTNIHKDVIYDASEATNQQKNSEYVETREGIEKGNGE